MHTAPGDQNSYNAIGRIATLASLPARVGLARLYAQVSFGTLPPRSQDEVRASTANASTVASTVEEYLRASASTQQAASLRDFGAKPLIVLTASVGHDAAWMTAQDKTATLSTNGAHRVIARATHEALVAEKKYAGATHPGNPRCHQLGPAQPTARPVNPEHTRYKRNRGPKAAAVTGSTCMSSAGPTPLARPPCTWPSSPPRSPCWSTAGHWPQACPTTASPN